MLIHAKTAVELLTDSCPPLAFLFCLMSFSKNSLQLFLFSPLLYQNRTNEHTFVGEDCPTALSAYLFIAENEIINCYCTNMAKLQGIGTIKAVCEVCI